MADPYIPALTIGPNGVVIPTEADILAGVLAGLNVAFGGGLNITNLETPQGQIAQLVAAVIGDKNNQIMSFVANVDPAFSKGRMQDGIGRIYFINRRPAQPTVVVADCIGATGTLIPVGATAIAEDGNIYTCTAGGIIGTGALSTTWTCNTVGAIACPAGSLNRPYRSIPGWDAINNSTDGIIGTLVENAAEFERRRYYSVAANSQGSTQAVRGAVLGIAGVLDAYVVDNPSASPATIGGVTLPAHSLYVAVSGGTDFDVAKAIWTKKSPGVTMVGNTAIGIPDNTYDDPKPTYTITFQRPTAVAIKVAVTLSNTALVPSNALAQIQNAIVNAFVGDDGSVRAKIGGTVYASKFYAPIAALGTWAQQIVSITVGTSSPASSSTVSVNADSVPTIAAPDVTLALV